MDRAARRRTPGHPEVRDALQQLDTWHVRALRASTDGLWEWEFGSDALRYSDRCSELLGYEKDEIPHTVDFFWESLHPDDVQPARAAANRCIAQGSLAELDCRLRTKQGEYRWFRVRAHTSCDGLGQPARMAGVIQDISPWKQAEEPLKERARVGRPAADLSTRLVNATPGRLDAAPHQSADEAVRTLLAENERLRRRLEQENKYLREQVVLKHHHGRIIGQSDALKAVLSQVERVAVTDAPVLLWGETGTGKELMAQTIHELSARRDRPMVVVNCASLPATLVESELFGREAGAYTGAASAQVGRFVVADGSTLFLDEVGEFPFELQAKLLRVLQDGRFERLGSPQTIKVNVRIIAATNRNLAQAVAEGKFRADLYHRLNVFPIHVLPLREHREDVPALAWAFVESIGRRMGKTIKTIPRRTMEQLQRYAWPGNVRELSNVIERAMILATDDTLYVELPLATSASPDPRMTLEESQRAQITRVLEECGWRIRGVSGAAEILGLKPTTLEARMAKLGIKRGRHASNIS